MAKTAYLKRLLATLQLTLLSAIFAGVTVFAADPVSIEEDARAAQQKLEEIEAAARGEVRQAADRYRSRLESFDPAYVRGKAYFDAGRWKESALEFERLAAERDGREADDLKKVAKTLRRIAEQEQITRKALSQVAGAEATLLPPQEFVRYLQTLEKRLAEESKSTLFKHGAGPDDQAKRAEILAEIDRGKALYATGKAEAAFALWRSVAERVGDRENIEAMIASIEAKHRAETEAASFAAGERRDTYQAETARMIRESFERLSSASTGALEASADASRRIESFQGEIDAAFARGKRHFEMGNYDLAIREFEKVLPSLQDGSALARLIEIIRQTREEERAAEETIGRLERGTGVLRAPVALSDTVREAEEKLRYRLAELEGDRARLDSAYGEKKSLLDDTIAKGRALYERGDFAGALQVWRGAQAFVERDLAFAEALDSLERAHDAYLRAQHSDAPAFTAPPEFTAMMKDAEERLRLDSQREKARRAQMRESFAIRTQRVEASIGRARAFYAAEDYANARQELESVLPDLEDRTTAMRLVELLKLLHEQATANISEIERMKRDSANVADASELAALAEELKSKIDYERKQIENRRFESGMARTEKALLFHNGVAEGKRLFERGDYAGALRLWRSLVPYLRVPGEIEPLIAQGEAALARRDELAASIDRDKNAMFQAPVELPGLIEEVVQRLDEQTASDAAQRETILASFDARRQRIYEAYKRARNHYAAEDPSEAARELELILPELADQQPTLRLIELLRALHDQREKTRIAVDRIRAEAAKLQSPPELVQLLRDTDRKIQASLAEVENEKTQTQVTYNERIRFVNWLFDYGKKLFEQGDYAQAIETWSDLVPYLENGPLVEGLIVNLKEAYGRYAAAYGESQEARATMAKAPAMPDFEASLQETARRFDNPQTLPVKKVAPPVKKGLPSVAGADADKALVENDRMMRELLTRKKDAR